MSWLSLFIVVILLMATIVLPGSLILRCWQLPRPLAFSAGPAVSVFLFSLASITYPLLHLQWNRLTVTLGLGFLTVVLSFLGLVTNFHERSSQSKIRLFQSKVEALKPQRLTCCLLIALACLLGVIPVAFGMGSAEQPMQAWDSVFHMSAIQEIRSTGQASPFGSLSGLYGGAGVFYPTAVYAILSLMPGTVPLVFNAGVLAFIILFPLNVIGLGNVVLSPHLKALTLYSWRDGPKPKPKPKPKTDESTANTTKSIPRFNPYIAKYYVAVVTAWITSATIGFTQCVTIVAVLPYSLSLLVLPGAFAMIVYCLRQIAEDNDASTKTNLIVLGASTVAAAGVVAAHGSGLFSLAILSLIPTVNYGAALVHRLWRTHKRLPLFIGFPIILLAMLGLFCLAFFKFRNSLYSVLFYVRPKSGIGAIIADLTLGYPTVGTFPLWTYGLGSLFVFASAVIGAVVLWRLKQQRWLIFTWVLLATTELCSVLPGTVFNATLAPWYSQRARFLPILWLISILLAVIGWSHCYLKCRARLATPRGKSPTAIDTTQPGLRPQKSWFFPAIVIVCLGTILTPLGLYPSKYLSTTMVYDPKDIAWGTIATKDELTLFTTAAHSLPRNAVILADPTSGAPYFWSLSGIKVSYPQLTRSPYSGDTSLLKHLDEIGSNPEICSYIKRAGITHYYRDYDPTANGAREQAKTLEETRELNFMPTSAVTPIIKIPGATLYQITACE